ncbi:substrate-binding domain-containing protein [Caldimonas brevitalea]|uniref:ABC-type tungstate transport system, periplasmic binding protein n=1 Tax=Caldimonas brevitalea TaxID=413882 RepID=A0A0G3C043_9BURK|nr:substrate-binding domain-containing protein [Caldimonas brevitalea]AKJ32155.1 ABC-type tungstate transport system, periplasmic binding protein [Caldimonas brevitalea]
MRLPRRHFLPVLFGAAVPLPTWAAPRSQQEPLLLGVATSLVDGGLAKRLQQGFLHDAGLAVQLVPGASGKLLGLLERGELDAALTHAPELEASLEKQGLVHDRRPVAACDFVLAGPLQGGKGRGRDPLGLKGQRDVVRALAAVAEAGARGEAKFVGGADRSGAQLKDAALFKAAGVAAPGGWYVRSSAGMGDTLALANAERAYVLVDRPTWNADARRRGQLGVIVEGDPRLDDVYHAMRPFRGGHPAAKLLVQWLTGPNGRRAVQSAPGGYRASVSRPA